MCKADTYLYHRLTYCFSFASLITTVGSVVDYWKPSLATSVGVSVLFVFLPILANLTDIMVSKYFLRSGVMWEFMLTRCLPRSFATLSYWQDR